MTVLSSLIGGAGGRLYQLLDSSDDTSTEKRVPAPFGDQNKTR
jgi:hypothetical protein